MGEVVIGWGWCLRSTGAGGKKRETGVRLSLGEREDDWMGLESAVRAWTTTGLTRPDRPALFWCSATVMLCSFLGGRR